MSRVRSFSNSCVLVLGLSLLTVGRAEASAIGLSSSTPGTLYSINTATGAATALVNVTGATVASAVGLDFLGGVLYASDVLVSGTFRFGTIDVATGAFTSINNQAGSANWHALAANEAGGFLYTVDINDGGRLKTVTPAGVVTTIGLTGLGFISGLAYDGATLYAASQSSLYTLNTATGAFTLVGSLGTSCDRMGLDIDPMSGTLYLNTGTGGACTGGLYTVNTATGAATLVGSNGPVAGFGIDGIAFQSTAAAVPEPGTVVLVVSGLVLAVARRRVRNSRG